MVLQCSGQAGDAFADDGDILGKIRDGDSLDTLIRTADEHGLRCEWAGAGGEREQPGLAAAKPEVEKAAEVHLRWASGSRASQSFAVLHRLDYNVWDGWLRPARLAGQGAGQVPPVRLTRNGVGYEMALAAVFRAMGEAMPEEFAVAYLTDQPKPAPDPEPPGLPAGQLAPAEAWLPMSYARYLIRRAEWFSSGMALACSGRTGGVFSDNQTILAEIQDGISLDQLTRMADEHRPGCEWAICPDGEREHPELTVGRRAEVHLKWARDLLAGRDFAKLHHHLDDDVWDAWLHPAHLEGRAAGEQPPVLLPPNRVSYEVALMSVFRAMGDAMPEGFAVVYIYDTGRNQFHG